MKRTFRFAKAISTLVRRSLAAESGQATVEYALVSSLMLLGAGFGSYWFLYKALMDAYNSYMGSIHFILNLALP